MLPDKSDLESRTLRKVAWRLIPFLFLLYVFNILDRTNINVAQLTMEEDLSLSKTALGLGSGIFFIGYFFFQVPSNLMLERTGARKWIAGVVMAWGIVAACLAFVRDPISFYGLRFLLGVAQAGFFPGIVLYLTYWFPDAIRGRAAARFLLANATAGILGNPIGGMLLQLDGAGGLQGWQWLFLLEGIPTFLLGFTVLIFMTDRPTSARWLSIEERDWLLEKLRAENERRQKHHSVPLYGVFRYPRVLHLGAFFFVNAVAGSGLGFFTNPLLKERLQGQGNMQILLIATLPTIVGALSLLFFSSLSDRMGERRRLVVAGMVIAAIGVAVVALTRSAWQTVAALCLINIGLQCANAPFWALASSFLSGAAAAAGLAFINSIGNSGSFFGPIITGWLKDRTGDFQTGLFLASGIWLVAALVAYLLPEDPARASLQKAGKGG